MADEVKKDEIVNQEVNKDLENQQIPYSRFKEVNERAKKLEQQLTEFKTQQEKVTQEAQERKAKEENDYSELKRLMAEKETAIKTKEEKLKEKVAETVLTSLAIREGILNPKYINLFEGEVDVDETLEIKNMKDVEDAFAKFKKDNSNLFNATKPVPKVDNQPVQPVKPDASKLSAFDKIRKGLTDKQ